MKNGPFGFSIPSSPIQQTSHALQCSNYHTSGAGNWKPCCFHDTPGHIPIPVWLMEVRGSWSFFHHICCQKFWEGYIRRNEACFILDLGCCLWCNSLDDAQTITVPKRRYSAANMRAQQNPSNNVKSWLYYFTFAVLNNLLPNNTPSLIKTS